MSKTRGRGVLMSVAAMSFGLVLANAQAATQVVQVVDKSGKPPFTRSFKQVQINDVAQLETANVEYVQVMTVDMSGKPPYRRVMQSVPVKDVAQLESAEGEETKTHFSGRPPFKRHQ